VFFIGVWKYECFCLNLSLRRVVVLLGADDGKNGFAVFVERLDVDDREGKTAEDGET
jgi:hypothetical protein